jgi:predicted transcriptional regulator
LKIDLDRKHASIVRELAARQGASADRVAEMALEILAVEALGGSHQRPLSDEEITAMKEALAEIERGEGIPHEQIVAELRVEFGHDEQAEPVSHDGPTVPTNDRGTFMSAMTIELDDRHARLLGELVAQSGGDAREVIECALEMLAEASLADSELVPISEEQAAAIEAGLADIEAGRVIPHEQVVREILAKFER